MTQDATIYLWDGMFLFAGHVSLANHLHRHYAASLLLAVDPACPFRLRLAAGEARDHRAILVAPNTAHCLEATPGPMIVVQVDPDAPHFRGARERARAKPIQELPDSVWASLAGAFPALRDGELAAEEAFDLCRRMLDLLGDREAPRAPLDPRLRRVLDAIRRTLPDCPTNEELATIAQLSPGRLMHVFKDQLGLPIRRFVLWSRIRQATACLAEGGTLTEAAHAAGFADSAHLSRTFREMFGLPPSRILARSRIVQGESWRA